MVDAAVASPVAPTLDDAKRAAGAVSADPWVRRVLLFGSVARGEADRGSDIDLMVLVADSCGYDEFCRLDSFARRAARGVVEWPVEVVLRRRSVYEHLVRNVSASLEAGIQEHAVVLYRGVSDSGKKIDPAVLDGVARDSIELAGEQAKSAVRSIGGIESEIDGIYNQESKIAAVEDAVAVRQLRFARILEASHMVLEQCFRVVSSVVKERSLGKGHHLDDFLAGMGAGVEKEELAGAVAGIRNSSGDLRTWRLTSYTLALGEWQREMTAENASAHIAAAVECARIAAACIAGRAVAGSPAAAMAATLDSAASSLAARSWSPEDLERGSRRKHPIRNLLRFWKPR